MTMDVEQLLFDLHVYSGDSGGYALTVDAVNLRLKYGEDWPASLVALQKELKKSHDCSYGSFQKKVKRISEIVWERNSSLLKKYAHRDLENAPGAKELIEILYVYILRNESSHSDIS